VLTRGRGYVLPDDVIASILAGIAVPYYDEDEARGLKHPADGDVFVR
jgi:hypothetical protein